MTKIETDKVEINSSAENIFKFLSEINNLEKLMPEQVVNWQSAGDECSFTIKGMGNIAMRIAERIPTSQVKIVSTKGILKFNLNCLIEENADKCNTQLILEAELNPMTKMMVEKPLGNFFNLLIKKLKEIHG